MNEGIKCPQCGGNKLNVLGQNNYKCLYCGTIFTPAPPAPPTNNQMNTNVQSETSGTSNIIVNVNIPNNSPNNIGEPLSFSNTNPREQKNYSKGKNKTTAGILGIFLGAFGGHHFYLGNTKRATIYLVLSIILSILGGGGLIIGLIGFIEGIILLFMNDDEFDKKYNY